MNIDINKTSEEIHKVYALYPGLKTYTNKVIGILKQKFPDSITGHEFSTINGVEGEKLLAVTLFVKAHPDVQIEHITDLFRWTSQTTTEPAARYLALLLNYNPNNMILF